jgi:hypothetical protein
LKNTFSLLLLLLHHPLLRSSMHRERVRAAYEAAGLGMEVPAELPRPLKVAQAVVARHPGTRSLHDGIILTIKSSKYRVQFNRWECAVACGLSHCLQLPS